MIYLQLFYEFFKTGLFAVGGGLATLPFLYDMADRTGWFTRPQLADMLAVSESTPGPIGVNMATYVGFITCGIPGAIISTLGLVTPSVIVILIIAAFLKAFRHNRYVEAAFLRSAPGVHGYGGGGGPVGGGHHLAEHRGSGPGHRQLEGPGPGGGDPGADPVGQAHQGPAPHRVHPGLRRGGRGVQLLKPDPCGQGALCASCPFFVCLCAFGGDRASGRGVTVEMRDINEI